MSGRGSRRNKMRAIVRLTGLLAAGAFAIGVSSSAMAMGNESPPASPPQTKSGTDKKATDSKQKRAPKKQDQDKKSEQQFLDGYKAAYATIYKDHDYASGIAQLRALKRDDHPDVANLIGFSSRKLGRYDDAKHWYEKALTADPNHSLTWSYYGMWHAEQGNLLKARDHLTKLASICGTGCREYVMLKEVIEGTRVY